MPGLHVILPDAPTGQQTSPGAQPAVWQPAQSVQPSQIVLSQQIAPAGGLSGHDGGVTSPPASPPSPASPSSAPPSLVKRTSGTALQLKAAPAAPISTATTRARITRAIPYSFVVPHPTGAVAPDALPREMPRPFAPLSLRDRA